MSTPRPDQYITRSMAGSTVTLGGAADYSGTMVINWKEGDAEKEAYLPGPVCLALAEMITILAMAQQGWSEETRAAVQETVEALAQPALPGHMTRKVIAKTKIP